MSGNVTDQVEPPCRTSSGAGHCSIGRPVTTFSTASRARLRRAKPGRARPDRMQRTRKSSKGIASWRESGDCQKPGGMAGDSPARGRQPAAPYGRKPTGRGAAAGRLSPLPQAGSPVRNAPTMTAPAELAGLPISRRSCSRRERSQPRRIGRLAGRLSVRGLEAASPPALTQCAAHCPGWPLQRQGHPKIVSNRFAETIFRTRP
jgi:hypothetical protein